MSVPKGWYVDPSTGTNLRWWSGDTWTDDVAPLPHQQTRPTPVDRFTSVEKLASAGSVQKHSPSWKAGPAVKAAPVEPAVESAPADLSAEAAPVVPAADAEPLPLTRRELRAREREGSSDIRAQHLPPITSLAEVATPPWAVPVEIDKAEATPAAGPRPRHRMVRMSVALSAFAVVTCVGVLTAGAL